jgi:hypothetical protein
VVRSEQEIVSQILKTQNPDWCGAIFNKGELEMVELPEEVYLKIQDRINSFYKEQERAFFKTDPQMQAVHLTKVVMSESWSAIESHRNKRISQKAEYADKALINEENKKKQLLAKKPNVEENKRKQLITEKQKAEEEKANKLLASMKPEERRSYICEKTYGFRKGSDKFSECVYKILAADVELEKLELQKKLAEAQLETARANEAAARANAAASASTRNVPAYDPAIGRAAERANEIETARLAFELARQLNPQRYAPQQQNNIQLPKQQYCKLNPINNRISCYTTP